MLKLNNPMIRLLKHNNPLLFAPQSGDELRSKSQTTTEQDWQKLQAEWQAGMEKTQQRLDKMQVELK